MPQRPVERRPRRKRLLPRSRSTSRQPPGLNYSIYVKRFPVFVQTWSLSFIVCVVAVALSFARLDVPIAVRFWKAGRALSPLNTAFGTAAILSV
jgi:hypothetical protein